MGLFSRKKGPGLTKDGWLFPADPRPVQAESSNGYGFDVVGERQCNANLRALIREEGVDVNEGGEIYATAMLLCEPKNPYDPNAVAVVINMRRVGYLAREDAKVLAPTVRKMTEVDEVLIAPARIGWTDPEIIGVRLDMKHF